MLLSLVTGNNSLSEFVIVIRIVATIGENILEFSRKESSRMSSAILFLVVTTLGVRAEMAYSAFRGPTPFTPIFFNAHASTLPSEADLPTRHGGFTILNRDLDWTASNRSSSSYWKKVFQDRENEDDSDFENDGVRQKNQAGYESNNYCVYDLRISYFNGSPDGVLKRITGFNGQFPGPVLTCTVGKTMIVRVTNDIEDDDEPTSVHWHGITQTLTPFYDGPQSVTQCPVIRDTSMIYKFQVFQAGTYWYHSHHTYQYADGAWGFLIIKNKPVECWQNSYDDERLISMNDWFHLPARNLSEAYLGGVFPVTDSSLVNGRGSFNCSNISPGQICNPALQGPAVVDVVQGKRYRFRILNSSAGNTFNFSIDAHKFVVIETDGVDTVKSPKVDMVEVYPGQRYSLIVIMDKPIGNYWIRINGEPTIVAGPPGSGVLRYNPNPRGFKKFLGDAAEPTQPGHGVLQSRPAFNDVPWDALRSQGGIKVPTREGLRKYFPHKPAPLNPLLQAKRDAEHAHVVSKLGLPRSSSFDPATGVVLDQNLLPPLKFGNGGGSAPAWWDQLVLMNQTDCSLPGQPVRLCMNGEPYIPLGTNSPPILYNVIQGVEIPSSARPIFTPYDRKVIRVVINNHHRFAHPWHLHGHSFWVLGAGAAGVGDFVASRDNPSLTHHGTRRDVTFTLPNSWAVIEYITDNPGTWFFHCHINWHLEAGLGMTFIESEVISRQIYKFPPVESLRTCARVGVTLN